MSNDFDYFFQKPFADTGDKIVVPVGTQPDGSVSFDTGFGFDYERDPDPVVDPLTKPVPRDQTNWLLNVITGAMGQMQSTGGAPLWSSVRAGMAGTGGGNGYPKDAKVYWADKIWTSIQDNNGLEPGSVGSSNWWTESSALDATLRAIAGLTPAANQMVYFTGTDVAALAAITSYGRGVVGAANSNDGLIAAGATSGFLLSSTQLILPDFMFNFNLKWGTTFIAGDGNFVSGNIFATACRFVIPVWAIGTPPDQRALQVSISGQGFTIHNPDGTGATCRYLAGGN